MKNGQDISRIVGRLETSMANVQMPSKVAAMGQSLITRLSTPVRIGLFGLPRAGKRECLNALVGTQIAEPGLPLSTLEVLGGEQAETHAVLSDGATLVTPGYPNADMMRMQPMFLQVQTPEPAITGRAYLIVAADAEAADMVAALDWAATRVDVAIWCTRDWSHFEQSIWLKAPDALMHHALLVGHDADGYWQDHGFQAAFQMSGTDGSTQLGRYLSQTIDEALGEDIDAADVFLDRYGVEEEAPVPMPARVAIPAQQTGTQEKGIEAEAHRALGRLFQTLRSEAQVLSETVDAQDEVTTLTAFEDLFETLAFEAQEEMIEESWPDLSAQICAARDLAVLMRLEGGAKQAEDSAHLLWQVRQNIETRLAA